MTPFEHYDFEWDPEKEQINIIKHGVDFSVASYVFKDALHIVVFDKEDENTGEERFWAIGRPFEELELVLKVVHVYRGSDECTVRIISARPTTSTERGHYETRS